MADAGIFIGFGLPARGREQMELASFNEAMGHFAALQQSGEIEGFEAVLLEPHGGDLGGFILLRGSADSLAHVRVSESFQHLIARAGLCVDGMGIVGAQIGEGLMREMAYYGEQVAKL